MRLGEARAIVGSIGFPSKMPGTSYALPARACIAGAALAEIEGSICSACYAHRTFYRIPRTQKGLYRRLEAIKHWRWAEAMVRVLAHLHRGPIRVDLGQVGVRLQQKTGNRGARIRWNEPGYHRWHDSGDLQSLEHFEKILEVCWRTPQIQHWLPTRELAIIRASKTPIPPNLTIRVSATMIDGIPPAGFAQTSTVHRDQAPAGAHECPAYKQDHQCRECRACWSRDVPLVSYRLH